MCSSRTEKCNFNHNYLQKQVKNRCRKAKVNSFEGYWGTKKYSDCFSNCDKGKVLEKSVRRKKKYNKFKNMDKIKINKTVKKSRQNKFRRNRLKTRTLITKVHDEKTILMKLAEDRNITSEERKRVKNEKKLMQRPENVNEHIIYEHGGFPPLVFGVDDGYFYIRLRSDSANFIDKSGFYAKLSSILNYPKKFKNCVLQKSSLRENMVWCNNFENRPHQKLKYIWFKKVDEAVREGLFTEWTNFKWRIKWTKYNNKQSVTKKADFGQISLRLNGKVIVHFRGKFGRNDGLVPYFKTGLYSLSNNKGMRLKQR